MYQFKYELKPTDTIEKILSNHDYRQLQHLLMKIYYNVIIITLNFYGHNNPTHLSNESQRHSTSGRSPDNIRHTSDNTNNMRQTYNNLRQTSNNLQ